MKRPWRVATLGGAALVAVAGSLFAAVPTGNADLSITKTRSTGSPAHPGDVIGYQITVTNNGPDIATNVAVSDPVPPNTTFDEGGTFSAGWSCTEPSAGATGTMTCTISALGAGATADFYMEAVVDQGKLVPVSIDNTATVSSDTPDPDTSNNASTVPTDVAPAPAPAQVPLSAATLAGLAAAVALAGVYRLRR